MKKSLLTVAAVSAALMMSVTSCNKKAEAPAQPAAPAEKTAEAAPAAPAKSAEIPSLKETKGYISANDLESAALKENVNAEDGFVLVATEEKGMAVEDLKDIPKIGDETFTKRISTKGSGKVDLRNVSFPAKKGDTVLIYAGQGGSAPRPLHVVDTATGSDIAAFEISPKDISTVTPDVFEVSIPADGTYCVYSTTGGCYLYQIKVGTK